MGVPYTQVWHVDPLSGNDNLSTTGTLGNPYATLSYLLNNNQVAADTSHHIKILNTAKLTETVDLAAAYNNFSSISSPGTELERITTEGTDSNGDRLPIGQYTDIDYDYAGRFYEQTGRDYFSWIGLNINQLQMAGGNGDYLFRTDNYGTFRNLSLYRPPARTGPYIQADAFTRVEYCFINGGSASASEGILVNVGTSARIRQNVLIHNQAGTVVTNTSDNGIIVNNLIIQKHITQPEM